MELLDEDKLAKFVRSIVIEMKPELKSNLNSADVKKMIEASSREWLNVGQSANYLGVSTTTFREWRKKYKIPSYTIEGITRWSKSDLDAFWKRRGVEGYL
ncbi:hypothetical protein LA2_05595 [Lactobacillus amylovorus GRL 1112]|uniref:Helix-turn-helix domain-containing protein n=1 Tax=Lactobacillus amylovorus (strain GRL 1112) TaxID=695560 RepID=E4SIS9_LACAR|nr:helix-turn-helix domain-containing protein [Lactobacillus amylovorus]ADQ59078.1 hypothetical protein LA2_05595 [Lactobacillus amylovorus GRL 1112]